MRSIQKKIFLTGGEGFIGASIIHKMVTLGYETASFDAQLNFIDNEAYYKRCLSIRKKLYKQPSKKYFGDIRDIEKLSKAVNDFRPDVIIHLAGLAMARPLMKFTDQMIPINMVGTFNVLSVFEKSKAQKIVYTSSSMAYGHFKQTPQTENFILDPINTYGACKASGEYFVKLSQKDWVIIRPTSVYGFCDCANRISQLLIDAAVMNRKAWVVKGETLDFSYIDDVANGFILAVAKPEASHETFNISRGEARGATEFAQIVKRHYKNFAYDVREPTALQVYRGPQDIDKARRILDFIPQYSIEKGIEKILNLIDEYAFYNF